MECQTGLRVITGGNCADQQEHTGVEKGKAKRAFARLLEEIGWNKKNTGWGWGMQHGGSRDYWRNGEMRNE